MQIEGAISFDIASVEAVTEVMAIGRANRAVAATACNAYSSRSHCVLLIDIESTDKETQLQTHGRLVLVDLAGSERVKTSGVEKSQLTEAQNINKSLSALGDVIGALTKKSAHIPFRNSTLTYLLKDSLGKDNKALMLVQVSPCEKDVQETLCSLRFASRVQSVELGKAVKKIDNTASLRQIDGLKVGTNDW